MLRKRVIIGSNFAIRPVTQPLRSDFDRKPDADARTLDFVQYKSRKVIKPALSNSVSSSPKFWVEHHLRISVRMDSVTSIFRIAFARTMSPGDDGT